MYLIYNRSVVKGLRFLLRRKTFISLMLFLLGIYTTLFSWVNIHITKQQKIAEIKYKEFYNVELVNNKPKDELIAYPGNVNIYNRQGEKFGELMNTPTVYSLNCPEKIKDSLINVLVYGWVWTESIDENCKLNIPENIRYRANTHIIARLNSGTLLDTIYTNELRSWMLISFSCFVPKKYLLLPDEFDDISGLKKFTSNINLKTTNTKRTGGVSVKPTIRPINIFEHLIWAIRCFISTYLFYAILWLLVRLYIPREPHDKKRSWINILIFLLSGMVIGGILLLF